MVHSMPSPVWSDQSTQTEPQKVPPPVCVPLLMLNDDMKKMYCYHGGKCRCDTCARIRQQMMDDLDKNFDEFIPHDRLKLRRPIRHALRRPYRLNATRVSEEMAEILLKHHLKLLEEYPIYYLDRAYYRKNLYKQRGPEDVGTQTEILIGNYGIDGCPCPNKSVCWDI